jgi:hypothetical protein
MVIAPTVRLNNIVWKLHEERKRNAELIALRKRYVEMSYAAQIRWDKQLLRSHLARMLPAVQRAFLQARLEQLHEKERQIRNPVSDE